MIDFICWLCCSPAAVACTSNPVHRLTEYKCQKIYSWTSIWRKTVCLSSMQSVSRCYHSTDSAATTCLFRHSCYCWPAITSNQVAQHYLTSVLHSAEWITISCCSDWSLRLVCLALSLAWYYLSSLTTLNASCLPTNVRCLIIYCGFTASLCPWATALCTIYGEYLCADSSTWSSKSLLHRWQPIVHQLTSGRYGSHGQSADGMCSWGQQLDMLCLILDKTQLIWLGSWQQLDKRFNYCWRHCGHFQCSQPWCHLLHSALCGQPSFRHMPSCLSLLLPAVSTSQCCEVTDTWGSHNTGTCVLSSHLDYCNALLFGIADSQLQQLQSVQNVTSWLVTGSHHTDPAVIALVFGCPSASKSRSRWFKLVYKCLHGYAGRSTDDSPAMVTL